jgi:hypothetical protein
MIRELYERLNRPAPAAFARELRRRGLAAPKEELAALEREEGGK